MEKVTDTQRLYIISIHYEQIEKHLYALYGDSRVTDRFEDRIKQLEEIKRVRDRKDYYNNLSEQKTIQDER